MATVHWRGGVVAVAQVDTGEITAFDAASTYTVTIGGYDISVAGTTDAATTAAALVSALNLSTHPYFAAVTWSVPSGAEVRGTGDVAGVPFAAALTVTGGTGTVSDFSTTTACTGPHHVNAADNWSGGALPGAADDAVVDGGPSLLYGLTALTSIALNALEVRQSFTGNIGLDVIEFATSVDGATGNPSVREYRATHLEVQADEIVIGEYVGPDTPAGAARLCIEQKKAGASLLDVRDTATTTLNARPAVRYLAAHASADVVVHAAPGGVGIAVEAGETSTVGDVHVAGDDAGTSVFVGQGTTLTSFEQIGGASRLAAAATVASIVCHGGTLAITGYDYLVTALDVHGGTVTDAHDNTGGDEWTTINVYGGTLVLPRTSDAARAYTTLNLYLGRVEGDVAALSGTEVLATTGAVTPRRAIDVTAL